MNFQCKPLIFFKVLDLAETSPIQEIKEKHGVFYSPLAHFLVFKFLRNRPCLKLKLAMDLGADTTKAPPPMCSTLNI